MYKESLFNLIRREEVVIWAGAGLSLYAGYPSGSDLCKILLEDLTESEKVNINKNLLLPNLAEEYFRVKGSNKNALTRLLTEVFCNKLPVSTEYHDKLSLIPHFKTIITTNYDKLFERSYEGKSQLVISNIDIPYLDKDKVLIFKVHGDLSYPDSLIITSSDYTKFFQRNKSESLYWSVVKERISTKSVLFLGYSLEDPNVEAVFNNITDSLDLHRREYFLVAPNLPQHKVTNLLHKGIHYIDASGESLIKELIEILKSNIVDDFRKGKVSADTFRTFLANFNISPILNAKGNRYNLASLEPSGPIIEAKINFTVRDNEELNNKIKDFISGVSGTDLRLHNTDVFHSEFWLSDILVEKDLKLIEFIRVPSNEWTIDIRFNNGVELSNIDVKSYASGSLIELHLMLKHAGIVIKFILNEVDRRRVNAQFDFTHNEVCGNVTEEIELYNFLCSVAKGVGFTIFNKNKPVHSGSFTYLGPALEEWSYFLSYFEKLKKVERYYNVSFSGLDVSSISSSNYATLTKVISYIEDKFYEEEWNGSISFILSFDSLSVLEQTIEKGEGYVFFHSDKEEVLRLHDQELVIGFPSTYILYPSITKIDQNVNEEKVTVKIVSEVSKRRFKYNKLPQQM